MMKEKAANERLIWNSAGPFMRRSHHSTFFSFAKKRGLFDLLNSFFERSSLFRSPIVPGRRS